MDNQTIKLKGEELYVKCDNYIYGSSIKGRNRKAIMLYDLDECYWGTVTVNVPEIYLDDDEVILSHDLGKDEQNQIIAQLGSGWTRPCSYGFVKDGVIMQLGKAVMKGWNKC